MRSAGKFPTVAPSEAEASQGGDISNKSAGGQSDHVATTDMLSRAGALASFAKRIA
jgi:hypothetical protein